jgi:predicted Zn-dependent peptidase
MSGADLIAQWKKDFVKARILVVVVGPVERAEIEKLIHSTLASLPAGSYQDPMLPEAAGNAARSLTTVKKKIPTTYIIGRCGAPSRKSPDYWPYAMYVTALQDDLFEEVRTKRNLSYAPAAQWDPSRIATSGIYVSTTKPDSAVGVMLRTIDRYQTSPITEKLLKGHVASWMTSLGKREEGVSSQAEALGRYQIYTGDWKNAFSIIDNISRVTPADVERVADRYMHKFSYAMVGDVDQIDKALYESK